MSMLGTFTRRTAPREVRPLVSHTRPLSQHARVAFNHRSTCSACGRQDVPCRISDWSGTQSWAVRLMVCAGCTMEGKA